MVNSRQPRPDRCRCGWQSVAKCPIAISGLWSAVKISTYGSWLSFYRETYGSIGQYFSNGSLSRVRKNRGGVSMVLIFTEKLVANKKGWSYSPHWACSSLCLSILSLSRERECYCLYSIHTCRNEQCGWVYLPVRVSAWSAVIEPLSSRTGNQTEHSRASEMNFEAGKGSRSEE